MAEQLTPDKARSMIPEFFANYAPAASMMAGGSGQGGLTPEMAHEMLHQQMQASSPAQAATSVQSQVDPMSGAPIATGDPGNPLADAAMANSIANNAGAGPNTQGFAPGGADPLRDFLQGQVGEATNAEDQAQTGLEASVRRQGAGLDTQTAGQEAELAAKTAEAQSEQPLLHERTGIITEFEKQQREIQAAGQRAFDAQMTRVRSAIAEANSVEAHSFWADASTGAKILGVIAQALSGAANGLAGNPSAVTPLDRIIEQDLQRQEYNIAQKNKAAYREQGVLNLIQKQTGDRLAAANAVRVAAWERVSAQIEEHKNAVQGATAEAQAQALHGLADQRKGMFDEKLQGILLQKAQTDKAQALRAIGTLDATQAALQKQRANAAQNKFSVIGVVDDGSINKAQYDKIAPSSEAYAKYLIAIKGMKEIAAKGMAANPVAQKKLYDQYYGQAYAAVRVMDNTGAALSKGEEGNVKPRVPGYYEVMTPGYSALSGGAGLLDSALDSVTDSYVGQLQALGIKSQINPNDQIAGDAMRSYVQRQAGR